MDLKQILISILLLNLAGTVFCIPEYVYEFGDKDEGVELWKKSDWIGWFHYETTVSIPTLPYDEITYVKVVVDAINPPKVDFHKKSKTVTIHYSLTEVTRSSYIIYVEGLRGMAPERVSSNVQY